MANLKQTHKGIYYDTSTHYGNKSKGVWRRADGSVILMGNRIKNSNGDYVQLNSDGTQTKLYDAKAHKFARGKDNRLLVNSVDMQNIASGHVKQGNSWRRDTVNSRNRDTGVLRNKNIYKGIDGLYHYFNLAGNVLFQNGKVVASGLKAMPKQPEQSWLDLTWDGVKSFAKGWKLYTIDPTKKLLHGDYKGAWHTNLEGLGNIGRGITGVLGGTVGRAVGAITPESWKPKLAKVAAITDLGKDAESIRTLVTPGQEWLSPDDARNQGLANKAWSWMGSDRDRQNILDAANGAISLVGLKGMGTMAKGLTTGVKSGLNIAKTAAKETGTVGYRQAAMNAGRSLANNKSISGVPLLSNVLSAARFVRSGKHLLSPGRTLGLRAVNVGGLGWHYLMTKDPMSFIYAHNIATPQAATSGWDPAYLLEKDEE